MSSATLWAISPLPDNVTVRRIDLQFDKRGHGGNTMLFNSKVIGRSDSERFEMRISPELLAEIEAWARAQPDNPPRATAIKRLVTMALAASARARREAPSGGTKTQRSRAARRQKETTMKKSILATACAIAIASLAFGPSGAIAQSYPAVPPIIVQAPPSNPAVIFEDTAASLVLLPFRLLDSIFSPVTSFYDPVTGSWVPVTNSRYDPATGLFLTPGPLPAEADGACARARREAMAPAYTEQAPSGATALLCFRRHVTFHGRRLRDGAAAYPRHAGNAGTGLMLCATGGPVSSRAVMRGPASPGWSLLARHFQPLRSFSLIAFEELGHGSCRWPVADYGLPGEKGAFLFCGEAVTRDGGPYREEHMALAYQRPRARMGTPAMAIETREAGRQKLIELAAAM